MIPLTDREMQRAWQENLSAYKDAQSNTKNSHRLLLFYAVECGLKAVLMNRERVNRTDDLGDKLTEIQHNLNKLLDELQINVSYRLPDQLILSDIKKPDQERKLTAGDINQVWRYGAKIEKGCYNRQYPKSSTESINDQSIERQLLKIVEWIEGELH